MQVAPRKPTIFHGDFHEDVEDWIDQYGQVARHNGWTPEQYLQNIYFSLEGTARTWFENYEASLTSRDARVAQLKRSFTNQHRRPRAEDLLQTRTQGPNESVTSILEDVLRLSARAESQATEEKKLRVLMKGVKSDIFVGLVRNSPTEVDGFVAEAPSIERALAAGANHFQRFASVATSSSTASSRIDIGGVGVDPLRDVIREVVREQLKKLLRTADQPALLSLAEIVRDKVQGSFQPEAPIDATTPEEPTLSYAAIARRPPPVSRQSLTPPRRNIPPPHYVRRQQ